MRLKKIFVCFLPFTLCVNRSLTAQSYPDQHSVIEGIDLFARIESSSEVVLAADGKSLALKDGETFGYADLKPDSSEHPFNRGLPSWNGTAPEDGCGFMIQMRFPMGTGWSPWLVAGYWKEFLWGSYGTTQYSGGYIDYDYVKLYSYHDRWQFRIIFKRSSADRPSPTVHRLSFFISDTRTTNSVDYTDLVNDNPDAVFIPTEFLYQYGIDPGIGGSICSPTSVAMILRSYEIEVDPLEFARDTKDPYFGMFGIWPRVVQNASEYGLTGSVTRYRTWSEARAVLASGGRIAMSVGPPLYSGHLMMLAGFNESGTPLVHDPARYSGYGYEYGKEDLSRSWFAKGGISYTFFLDENQNADVVETMPAGAVPADCELFPSYPNPFNLSTRIPFSVRREMQVRVSVFDPRGRLVDTIYDRVTPAGHHVILWHAPPELPSGVYSVRLSAERFQKVVKTILLK